VESLEFVLDVPGSGITRLGIFSVTVHYPATVDTDALDLRKERNKVFSRNLHLRNRQWGCPPMSGHLIVHLATSMGVRVRAVSTQDESVKSYPP
jgi:hypothetical protein